MATPRRRPRLDTKARLSGDKSRFQKQALILVALAVVALIVIEYLRAR